MNNKLNLPLIVLLSGISSFAVADSQTVKEIYQLTGQSKTPLSNIKHYSQIVPIGFEDRKVPINIKWKVGLNKNNCLVIDEVRILQDTTSTKLKIKKIGTTLINKEENNGCVLEMHQSNDIKHQVMMVNMEFTERKWIKTYDFKGSIGLIQGNGRSKFH